MISASKANEISSNSRQYLTTDIDYIAVVSSIVGSLRLKKFNCTVKLINYSNCSVLTYLLISQGFRVTSNPLKDEIFIDWKNVESI